MKATNPSLSSSRALLACVVLGAGMQAPAVAGDDDCLVRPFAIAAAGAWSQVAMDLRAQNWHVGHAAGAAVTDARLRERLAQAASITVAGQCRAKSENGTHWPCGFALAAPALDGHAGQHAARQWRSITGVLLITPASPNGLASVATFTDGSETSNKLGAWIGFTAPRSLISAWTAAPETTLRFRFRALPNVVSGEGRHASEGVVRLCAGPAPAPSTDPSRWEHVHDRDDDGQSPRRS